MSEPTEQKGTIWLLIILVMVVFAVSVLFFKRGERLVPPDNISANGSNVQNGRKARLYTVFYGFGVFSPTNIRIHAGDSVRFQNDGTRPIRVSTDATDNVPDLLGFDSVGDIPPEGAFTYTFTKPGIFGYHNVYNDKEEGVVIVRP